MINPSQYLLHNTSQKRTALKFIDEYADELKAVTRKCMEVGCGPGELTINGLLPALSASATITATDISVDMVNHANQLHVDKKRIVFEILDVETENLPEKYVSQFQHVFSSYLLQWCNARRMFENIYKMLEPGGSTLVFCPTQHDIYDIFEILSKNACYAPYAKDIQKYIGIFHYSTRPVQELKDLLKSIGFQINHCSNREIVNIHTLNTFLPSVLALLTFLSKMPKDLADKFLADCKREYMERKVLCKKLYNGQEQMIAIDTYEVIIVYAKKPNL